jgi:hypothetical protein
VGKAAGDFAGGSGTTKMDGHENLSPRRMRQRGDDVVERRQFLGRV